MLDQVCDAIIDTSDVVYLHVGLFESCQEWFRGTFCLTSNRASFVMNEITKNHVKETERTQLVPARAWEPDSSQNPNLIIKIRKEYNNPYPKQTVPATIDDFIIMVSEQANLSLTSLTTGRLRLVFETGYFRTVTEKACALLLACVTSILPQVELMMMKFSIENCAVWLLRLPLLTKSYFFKLKILYAVSMITPQTGDYSNTLLRPKATAEILLKVLTQFLTRMTPQKPSQT